VWHVLGAEWLSVVGGVYMSKRGIKRCKGRGWD